jgi:hypothetical protein
MQTLIGLSQTNEYCTKSSQGNYEGLSKYLGTVPYNKILLHNLHTKTTKLYKAAVFYLLEGLSSQNPMISEKSAEIFKELVLDYVTEGIKDPSAVNFQNSIFAIAAGMELQEPNPELVAKFFNHDEKLKSEYAVWKQSLKI